MSPGRKEIVIAARKRRVAVEEAMIAGQRNGRELAIRFGVHFGQISRDIKKIEREWAQRERKNSDLQRATAIAMLRKSAFEAMTAWELSKQPEEEITETTGGKSDTVAKKLRYRPGDPAYLKLYQTAVTEVARLQGLYVDRSEINIVEEARPPEGVDRDAILSEITRKLQGRLDKITAGETSNN